MLIFQQQASFYQEHTNKAIKITRSHITYKKEKPACFKYPSVRGAPWTAAKRLHGQRTGAISWRPVLGFSRKTDQFRLDPTQNCAPGWWCDRESSVYHLALEMYTGIFRHATMRLATCPSCIPNTSSIPAPIQPTIAMTTTHIHQLLLTRPPSTRSSSASEDHPQAPVVTQQQQEERALTK